MTTAALERLRQRLAPLIEAAAAEAEQELRDATAQARAELEQMEAASARAIEYASSTGAVAAAYQQGRVDREREVLALIEEQREMLARGGVNSVSLATLTRRIQGS